MQGIWIFRSRFAETISTLVEASAGEALIVDPPVFPDEAEEVREFSREMKLAIKRVVVTHAHGDHSYGTVHFPEAELIAHASLWDFWKEIKEVDREFFARFLPGFEPPEIRPPDITFREELRLDTGTEIFLRHAPGHSPDSVLVELPGKGVWIAGDTVIPIPLIASGSLFELLGTLKGLLKRFRGQTIIPGHGRPLKGKAARAAIEGNIRYLEMLRERVAVEIDRGSSLDEVLRLGPEKFGISARNMGGLGLWIHRENLKKAYSELSGKL